MLIREFAWSEDEFGWADEGEPLPDGPVLVPLARLKAEADFLTAANRLLGVRVEPDERVEDLAAYLGRLAMVALAFPKFRDGRAYSSAALLRTRLGFAGELRAVGEVLVEQAPQMIRCGFDAFEPADGSTPEDWVRKAALFRHVYQRAEDGRAPVFEERAHG